MYLTQTIIHLPLSLRPNNIQRKVYCYKKADFKGLQETLQSIPWNLVTCDNCIDTGLIKFQDLLFAAVNQHIPQITLKRRTRPPWICNDIMKLYLARVAHSATRLVFIGALGNKGIYNKIIENYLHPKNS